MKTGEGLRGVLAPSAEERGIVLVLTLLVITFLSLLGFAFLTLSVTENNIANNEVNASKAFYLAEVGVALAKQTLKNSGDWDTELAAAQPFTCPAIGGGGNGSCSYLIENDPADPGGPTNDTNDLVVVTSTGTYWDTVKAVEEAVNRPVAALPEPPAGLTSVGVSSNVSFSGNAFTIDGNNWIPPSDDGSTPASQDNTACGSVPVPKYGIAVPNATHQLDVKDDLSSPQQDNVTGATPNPPWGPPSGIPSIGVDTSMSQSDLVALVDQLMPVADLTYAAGTQISSGTLGTQADPKIVVVDATSYGGSDPALTLSASKGAGILIIKNGTLRMTGSTQWVGIVFVIGSNVAIDIQGGGNKAIYGSILLAEDANVNATVAEGGGNLKVRYSCQGVDVGSSAGGGGTPTPQPSGGGRYPERAWPPSKSSGEPV